MQSNQYQVAVEGGAFVVPDDMIGSGEMIEHKNNSVTIEATNVTVEEEKKRGVTRSSRYHNIIARRDRMKDLVRGRNIQLGDWIKVLNPKPDQSSKGEIVVKTRDNLYRIKGAIRIRDEETEQTLRRGHMNMRVITDILH